MSIPMIAKTLFGYGGRDILPGSLFEAENETMAKLLHMRGKADYRTVAIQEAPLQKPLVAVQTVIEKTVDTAEELEVETEPQKCDEDDEQDEAVALRVAYREKFGKRPYMGWDAETLRQKLEASEIE